MDSNDSEVHIKYTNPLNDGRDVKYELIKRMEFTSERKRMSILIKDKEDGLIKLYTKGADSEICKRLDNS